MYRKGIPHVLRRGCHKHDQQVRVGRTQPLRRLNAIGALHADVQKHHLIPFAPAGPQKFISAGKTAAGYVLIFKCLFQQLFQPFGIRLAVFHDRRPQVHCCTPCSFCFPVFLYYSTSSAFRGLPFAHKTARFTQVAAVGRNFFVFSCCNAKQKRHHTMCDAFLIWWRLPGSNRRTK